MAPGCVFCGVVAGEVAAHTVHRDGEVVAILDHRPLFPGHVLVLPVEHRAELADLPAERVGPFFSAVRQVAGAVETAMDAHGTFVAINNKVSQSVPHLHVHVVPRRFKDGLRGFFWPRQRYAGGEDEMAEVAAAIRRFLP
ncbi:MAG TPA: HIT family protein [Acidimicrobiales bacterium]|nr:HIT family protein [Acidimicrobiales bacterium]